MVASTSTIKDSSIIMHPASCKHSVPFYNLALNLDSIFLSANESMCFQRYINWTISFLFFLLGSHFAFAQPETHQEIVDSLNQAAWKVVESDPKRATFLVEQTLEQAERISYPAGKAFSLNTSGVLAQNAGVYDTAEQCFKQALIIRLELGDSSLIASVYHNLASLSEMIGNCGAAFDYALKAIKIWERSVEEEQLGKAYNTFASIHECNQNYEDAIDYSTRSLNKLKPFENWEAIADAEYNLGRRFYDYGEGVEEEAKAIALFDSALVHFEKALQLFVTEVEDNAGHAWTLNGLAVIQMKNGNLEIAERQFYGAIEKASTVGDSLGIFDMYCNLSLIAETREDYDKALALLQEADRILGDRGSDVDRQYLYEQYAEIYQNLGDYKSAYRYLNQVDSFKTIFHERNLVAELAQKEAEYKNDLLKKENETQRIKAQNSRLARNVFGIVAGLFFVIICLGTYLVRQRRKNVKIHHQQEIDELLERQERKFMDAYFEGQEEEKKKFSDQLHTHLGSLLVTAKWDYDGLLDEMENGDSQWTSKLRLANTKLQNVYQEVRQQSHEFSTSRLEKEGLIAAMKDLCQTISESGRIKAVFNSFGLNERLDTKIEISVYRIIQELISNVLKHANAKHLNVQINPIGSELSVLVEDDGDGFDYEKALASGIGLTDIIARVESLEGKVSFDTNKGAGTTVIVDIPLKISSSIKNV